MKIEVGKRYLRRDGTVVTIGFDDYPFRGSDGVGYTADGNYYLDGVETDQDLVEEYIPAGLTPAIPEPPKVWYKTPNERYGEPEPGWRWLDDDEKVEEGDEFENHGSFCPSGNHRLHGRQDENAKPYRRRVANPVLTPDERYGEPEPGWRWLDDDEKVEEGDECYLPAIIPSSRRSFVTSNNAGEEQCELAKPYRRRVAPPPIQLRHGRTYLTRGGSCVTVGRVPDNVVFTFKSWQDTYTSDGRTHLGGPHDNDIVKELDNVSPAEPVKPEPESVVLYECLCRYGSLWQIEWVSDTTLRGVQWQQDKSNPGYMISAICPDEVLRTGKSQWIDLAGLRRDQPKL